MANCTCNNFPANLGNVTFGANVGIGVTPAAWDSAFTGLQIGGTGTISAHSAAAAAGHAFNIMQNAYYRGSAADFSYLAADAASRVMLGGGAFQVFTAPSGGVDAVIPWTERVRVANDGKVGINTTNPSEKLEVNGNVKVAGKGTFGGETTQGPALWSSSDYFQSDFTRLSLPTGVSDVINNVAIRIDMASIQGQLLLRTSQWPSPERILHNVWQSPDAGKTWFPLFPTPVVYPPLYFSAMAVWPATPPRILLGTGDGLWVRDLPTIQHTYFPLVAAGFVGGW